MLTANKALILDLGGVILYPPRGDWNIPKNYREILGSRADEFYSEKFRSVDSRLTHIVDPVIIGGTEDDEFRVNVKYFLALSSEMGWELTESDAEKMAYFVTYTTDRHAYYDDAKEYLAKWKREYALSALSDTLPSIYHYMEETGLAALFDCATYSVEVGAMKPDGRMYETALKKLSLPPENCVFVDDKVENLRGAEKYGIKTVRMMRPFYTNTPIEPNPGEWDGYVAHSLKELDEILKGTIFPA